MTAPPGVSSQAGLATLKHYGIATVIASQAPVALSPDEAALIAEYKAAGRRLSPSRARLLVAEHLREADRRADRDADPDRDTRILGMISDPTPADAFRPAHLRHSA